MPLPLSPLVAMDVRRPTNSLPSSPVSPAGSARADGTARGAAGARHGAAQPAAGGDRLDLSAEAHAAQRRPAASANAEVEQARVALRAGGDLSAERLHELRERVRTGYYDQPEAIDRVATAALRGLADGGSEA